MYIEKSWSETKAGKGSSLLHCEMIEEWNSLKSDKIAEYRSRMDRYILTLLFEWVRVVDIVSTFEYEDIVPSLLQQIVKLLQTLLQLRELDRSHSLVPSLFLRAEHLPPYFPCAFAIQQKEAQNVLE